MKRTSHFLPNPSPSRIVIRRRLAGWCIAGGLFLGIAFPGTVFLTSRSAPESAQNIPQAVDTAHFASAAHSPLPAHQTVPAPLIAHADPAAGPRLSGSLSPAPAAASKAARQLAGQPSWEVPGLPSAVRYFTEPGQPDATPGLVAADYLLAQARPGVSLPKLRQLTAHLDLQWQPVNGSPGLYRAHLPDRQGDTYSQTLAALRQARHLLRFAEPDPLATAASTPNDPSFNQQWHLHNTGQTGGLADADIDAPEGWDTATAAASTIVAIVDSGARLTHEDLADNLWTNPDEVAGDGLDNDSNGIIDDLHGLNSIGVNTGDPTDDNGHGTHLAGVIGAVGNNGLGVAGVAWQVSIMPLKFKASNGTGFISNAVECIAYAREKGAHLIVCSWTTANYSNALDQALTQCRDAGIIVCAAPGNAAQDLDFNPVYPASLPLANIVVTAATDKNDQLLATSNYGAESVDLGAPGEDVLATSFAGDSAYETRTGTSVSSAVTAGVLALLKSHHPSENYATIISRLLNGADPLASLGGLLRTGARANLDSAQTLGIVVEYPQIASPLANQEVLDGTPVSFTVAASGAGLSYAWEKDGSPLGAPDSPTLNLGAVTPGQAGFYRVVASNSAGSASSQAFLSVLSVSPALGQALDAEGFSWITGGTLPWESQTLTFINDGDAARSGSIAENQDSKMRLSLTGPGVVSFQWKVSSEAGGDELIFSLNGVVLDAISGETAWASKAFEIASGTHALEWIYRKDADIVAGDDAGYVDQFNFVLNGILPPAIVSQPVGGTVLAGANVTLSMIASGSGTFTYEWFRNDTPVDNSNTPNLALNSIALGQAGQYRVEVTNAGGTTTSKTVTLNVVADANAPSITVQPAPQSELTGGRVTFSVTATGPGTLSYQWQKNNVDIPNAHDPDLILAGLDSNSAGSYRVAVTNASGTVYSDPASLTVLASDASLAAAVDNLVLPWRTFGAPLWASQTLESADGIDAAQTGAFSNTGSVPELAWLQTNVAGPGVLSFSWKQSTSVAGDQLALLVGSTLTVTAIPNADWKSVYVSIPQGVSEVFWRYTRPAFSSSITADAGWVDQVEYIDLAGSVPFITVPPAPVDVVAGQPASFTVQAAGPGPFNYQWKKGPDDLSGENGDTLTIDVTSLASAGQYSVVVSNAFGPTTSASARLFVFDDANPLGDAADLPALTWTASGNANWFPQTQTTHDGVDALRSGALGDSQTSAVTTNVTGPGTLSFYWKVSSEEDFDLLTFRLDGSVQQTISGEVDWTLVTFAVPAGPHALAWVFSKDESFSGGLDAAWLDQVAYSTGLSFGDWRTGKFDADQLADNNVSGPLADPDGDGLSNLLEWATNGLPLSRDAALHFIPGQESVSGTKYITLTFTKAKGRTGLTLEAQQSSTLQGPSWTTSGVELTLQSEDANVETWKARIPVASPTLSALRLRAISTP